MAIQEIEKKENISGTSKDIEESAKGMILDVVQAQMYNKPVQSAVRESVSNAIDAQIEKERAIEILTGKAEVSDYFVDRKGDLYKDSKWTPEYYDLKHLNTENNNVELEFIENEGNGRCCRFVIKDYGVGIGLRRLQGTTRIGYSTKRCRSDVAGSFGLGLKSPLAVGTDYYFLETVHNGLKYRLKLFSKTFQCCIGRFDEEGNNIPYEFKNEAGEVIGVCYGKPVTDKNYTKIEIPVMKHHRTEYDVAVKTQLMFFQNVTYNHVSLDGTKSEVRFKSRVHYNSDNIIVADNVPYDKPYIVIVNGNSKVGVCYGYIEFEELELEKKFGSVGIKCRIRQAFDEEGEEKVICEGVDVVASRESVRWTANTRNYVLSKFEEAKNEATDYISEKLNETDLIKWIEACQNMISFSYRDNTLSKLSKIVELDTLRPTFSNTQIRYNQDLCSLFDGFTVQVITEIEEEKNGIKHLSSSRKRTDNLISASADCLVLKTNNKYDYKKDLFILDKEQKSKVVYLVPKEDEDIEAKERKDIAKTSEKVINNRISKIKNKRDLLLQLLNESGSCKKYDDYEVTEEFEKHISEKNDSLNNVKTRTESLTPAERRKLSGKIVVHQLYPTAKYNQGTTSPFEVFPSCYDNEDVFYGHVEDKELLFFAQTLIDQFCSSSFRNTPRIILIAKNNVKYFKDKKHINSFFGDYEEENGKIKIHMNETIIKWNTGRKINKIMSEFKDIMYGFEQIDPELKSKYEELNDLCRNCGISRSHNQPDFVEFLDKLELLQNFINSEESDENIVKYIKDNAVNVPENTNSVLVVDEAELNKCEEIQNHLKNSLPLLKYHSGLLNNKDLSVEEVMAIKEYIEFKNN